MSIVSVDNIQPIGSGTTVTVNKSVTLESGNTNITGVCTATSFSGSGANLTSLPAQATIANNGNDRIITGGSGVNLNGEANFVFDGTNLGVGQPNPENNSNFTTLTLNHATNGGVLSFQKNGSRKALLYNDISTGDLVIQSEASRDLRFYTNGGNERLRIESDGKVGIGTNNPSQMLTVGGTILKTRSDSGVGLIYLQNDGSQNGQIIVNQNGGVTRVKLDSAGSSYITGGNLALGNSNAVKKFHISTTGNQKILIDPNYANNSGGSSNTEANANNIVESILIRTSFGDNAASQTNAGHKWGIKFQGYNGNDFTQAISKCAGVFAVSEDEAGGYNRNVGLTFHTSPYNTNHREVMRINTNGIVTKPYQYMFTVETNGTSKTANWSKITGLTPDANQCTGVSDGTNWSNSTQRFTAPVAGIYHFFVGGWSVSASNGSRYAYTFKHTNGNYYNYIGGGNYCLTDSPMDGFSRTIKLSAGEWVELWGFSSVATTWGGGHRFFWGGYLLG